MTNFNFYHPISIRYMDLDPQWHVNNAKFLSFLETARMEYLLKLGLWDGKDFFKLGLIFASVHLDYLAQIKLGQNIRVGVRVTRMGTKSLDMEYEIQDADTLEVLARGITPMVSYDYTTSSSRPIPDEWRKTISRFEGIPEYSEKKANP